MIDVQHTPEPWKVDSVGVARVTSTNGRRLIASAGGHSSNVDFEEVDTENKANARRIVACVNICTGIETAALEQGRKFNAVDEAYMRVIEKERDEARAMVADMAELLSAYHAAHSENARLPDICRTCELILKAEALNV